MSLLDPPIQAKSAGSAPVFWGLVALSFVLLAVPIWYGQMPPLTDFGSHVQLVHGYLGAEDPTSVWYGLVERAQWWHPNGVWVLLSAWLHPMLEPLTSMRLWYTLCLLAGVLGQVHLLETFARSRWLIFVALPFLMWNGMAALGFVNFVPALALVPWAVAAARRVATTSDPNRRDLALLVLLPLLGVWFHGLGGLLVIGCSGLILVISLRSVARVTFLSTLLPACAYWLFWFVNAAPTGHAVSVRDGFGKWLITVRDEALGVFESHEGELVFYALMFALILHAVGSRLLRPRTERSDSDSESTAIGRKLWAWVAANPLPILLFFLVVAYRLLPRYRGDVALAERLIPVILLVLCALPSPAVSTWGKRLANTGTAIAIVSGLGFAGLIVERTVAFDREELALAIPLVDQIPVNSRAQCVNVRFVKPVFARRPLDHGCNGLLASRRAVFAGGGFADTPHNAVRFKPNVLEHRVLDDVLTSASRLSLVDYLLVRGPHVPPRSDWAESLGEVRRPDDILAWTLYRSRLAQAPDIVYEDSVGGPGGVAYRTQCPEGFRVSALQAVMRGAEFAPIDAGVECIPSGQRGEAPARRISMRDGPSGRNRTLRCPKDSVIVGLEVRVDTVVRGMRLVCENPAGEAPAKEPEVLLEDEDDPGQGGQRWLGQDRGTSQAIRCPKGTVLTGLTGRRGALLDRLGIRCSPSSDASEPAP